jgi:hypothetical protein
MPHVFNSVLRRAFFSMTEHNSTQAEIKALRDKIAKLQEMDAATEAAKLAALEKQIIQRKLVEEAKQRAAQDAFDKQVAAQIEKRRKAEEERLKIEAQKRADDLQLELARNAAEEAARRRVAEQNELNRLSALAWQAEQDILRKQADIYKLQNETIKETDEQAVVTIQSPKHPMSIIFGNREAGAAQPVIDYSSPAKIEPAPAKKFTPTALEVASVLETFPTSSRPQHWEVVELLRTHPVGTVLEAIKLFRDSWSRSGLASGYAIEQIENYCINTPAGDSK